MSAEHVPPIARDYIRWLLDRDPEYAAKLIQRSVKDASVSSASRAGEAGTDEIEQLRELLADLAMEGKIRGLGDTVAETNDQTGVLGRVRATLGSDFLDGRAEHPLGSAASSGGTENT